MRTVSNKKYTLHQDYFPTRFSLAPVVTNDGEHSMIAYRYPNNHLNMKTSYVSVYGPSLVILDILIENDNKISHHDHQYKTFMMWNNPIT